MSISYTQQESGDQTDFRDPGEECEECHHLHELTVAEDTGRELCEYCLHMDNACTDCEQLQCMCGAGDALEGDR